MTMTFLDSAQRANLPSVVATAAGLDRELANATPAEVVQSALRIVGRDKLAVVSSFGTESAALLKIVADVDPAVPVIFLDTGWLFAETLDYRDQLTQLLGLRDVRTIKPLDATLQRDDPDKELWFSDPDACCRIRKVEPLARARQDGMRYPCAQGFLRRWATAVCLAAKPARCRSWLKSCISIIVLERRLEGPHLCDH
jgi:phosphoadenosine phosphosulfate reductase